VDKNQFQQVFFNLLSNAIKYAAAVDDFRVFIDGKRVLQTFDVWINDYGPGIQQGQEELIFESGYRGTAALEKNVVGQGLGLWVVRTIVQAHGGTIILTKHRNPTQFTIRLPECLQRHPLISNLCPSHEPP